MSVMKTGLPAILASIVILSSSCSNTKRARDLRRRAADFAARAVLATELALLDAAINPDTPQNPASQTPVPQTPVPETPRPEGVVSSPVHYHISLTAMHDTVVAALKALGGTIVSDEMASSVFLMTARVQYDNIGVTHHLHGESLDAQSSTLQYVTETGAQQDPSLARAARSHHALREQVGSRLAALERESAPVPH